MSSYDSDEYDFEPENDESWDDTPTVNCATCKRPVYEDAQQCPYCLEFITTESQNHFSPMTKMVIWLLILSLVLPTLIFVASILLKN